MASAFLDVQGHGLSLRADNLGKIELHRSELGYRLRFLGEGLILTILMFPDELSNLLSEIGHTTGLTIYETPSSPPPPENPLTP